MVEEIERVRELAKARKNYREVAKATGVNPHWLAKFAMNTEGVSGYSRKGMDYVQRLSRYFETA